MNVESIEMIKFMKHDHFCVELPPCGTVLVTGPNGSGKSTVCEAVAWGLWGQTLRGSKPWRDGEACRVTIVTDRLVVRRKRSPKGTTSLVWNYRGKSHEDFDNYTKAQFALEKALGTPFDVWRKTHVLTSADAAQFTQATDAARKRVLEDLLGIWRIDEARTHAKADYDAAKEKIRVAEAHLSALQRGRETSQRTLQLLQPPPEPPEMPAKEELTKLADQAKAAVAESERITEQRDALSRQLFADRRKIQELRKQSADEICPTCGQTVSHEISADVKKRTEREIHKLEKAVKSTQLQVSEWDDMLEEAAEEMAVLKKRHHRLTALRGECLRAREELDRYRITRAKLQQVLDDNREEQKEFEEERRKAAKRADVLKVVCAAYGMKGFRAHMLNDAVGGVEALANNWLAIICDDARLRIKLYIDPKGNVQLEVDGAGGGHGYKAASTGERRRIDVAILLALAEVAASVGGATNGTLFLDELFDSLDREGVAGICDVLRTLSIDRSIIVVTHNTDLQGMVESERQISLDGGGDGYQEDSDQKDGDQEGSREEGD